MLLSLPGYTTAVHFILVFRKSALRNWNSAAPLLTKTKKKERTIPVLDDLHWLRVYFRIDFKVFLITKKTLDATAPSNTSEFVLDLTNHEYP